MSIFASWIATFGFFFVVFLVGKYLQNREKQEKLTRKAEDALREEMRADFVGVGHPSGQWISVYGTRYGEYTQFERRSQERRRGER